MRLTDWECACGQPMFEHMVVCSECGADNPAYVGFGWGRWTFAGVVAATCGIVIHVAVLERLGIEDRTGHRLAFLIAGAVFVAVRGLLALWDSFRAFRIRAKLPPEAARDASSARTGRNPFLGT